MVDEDHAYYHLIQGLLNMGVQSAFNLPTHRVAFKRGEFCKFYVRILLLNVPVTPFLKNGDRMEALVVYLDYCWVDLCLLRKISSCRVACIHVEPAGKVVVHRSL